MARVGLVDSGVDAALEGLVEAAVAFDGDLKRVAATPDRIGHGSAVAETLLSVAPDCVLLNAQAFREDARSDMAAVAAGILWCVECKADVINLSFGLANDHAVLRAACRSAVESGAILVASHPARGRGVFPAAHDAVVAVTGDARCRLDVWSVLETGWLFGAAPLKADGVTPGGASFAAARLSGLAARYRDAHPDADGASFLHWLEAGAAFRGRERRTAAVT